jgi:uncharacterized membrane protein YqaE (UPF0057 family)
MQKMKFTALLVLVFAFLASPTFAMLEYTTPENPMQKELSQLAPALTQNADMSTFSQELAKVKVEEFLNLTPKKYRELTGEKLGIKKTLQLKAAQKFLKKSMNKTDIPKGLYIVLVIFGWGFLAMGLLDDWTGKNWWMNLLLTFLCWIPGVIHGLIKMKEYYK